MPQTYVLYHDHCPDGFGAAWAFHRTLGCQECGQPTTYLPQSYGDPMPWMETWQQALHPGLLLPQGDHPGTPAHPWERNSPGPPQDRSGRTPGRPPLPHRPEPFRGLPCLAVRQPLGEAPQGSSYTSRTGTSGSGSFPIPGKSPRPSPRTPTPLRPGTALTLAPWPERARGFSGT